MLKKIKDKINFDSVTYYLLNPLKKQKEVKAKEKKSDNFTIGI